MSMPGGTSPHLVCPKCASASVQRAEIARSLGRSKVNLRGNTIGVGIGLDDTQLGLGIANTNVEGLVETEFAQALAPPAKSLKTGGFIGGGTSIAVFVGAIIGAIWGFRVLDDEFSDAFAIISLSTLAYGCMVGIIAVTALTIVYRSVFRSSGTQLDAIDTELEYRDRRNLQRWRQQWVCLVCGERFTLSSSETEPTDLPRGSDGNISTAPTGSRALWTVLVLAVASPWLLNRSAADAVDILMNAGSQLLYAFAAGSAIGVLVVAGHRIGLLADSQTQGSPSPLPGTRISARSDRVPEAAAQSRQIKQEFEQWLAEQPVATRPVSVTELTVAFSDFKKARGVKPPITD